MTSADVDSIREVIKRREAFYEVLPYHVVIEERLPGRAVTTRRIQAGFDIDVYGNIASPELGRSPDRALSYAALQDIAETTTGQSSSSCSIEVIPFDSTLILDSRRKFQPEGMLRIRITHSRGLDQPSGVSEESALRAILRQLDDLGVSSGNSRAQHR
jgi:hypothetical protein